MRTAAAITHRVLRWSDERVPFGIRSVIGVLFLIGGLLGFLPVLGFWMLPLGAALIALDTPWWRHKVLAWMASLEAKARG